MSNPWGEQSGRFTWCCRCAAVAVPVGTDGRGSPALCARCLYVEAAAERLRVHPNWLDEERAAEWRRQTARLDARLAAKRTRAGAGAA